MVYLIRFMPDDTRIKMFVPYHIDPTKRYTFPFMNVYIENGYLYLRNGGASAFTRVEHYTPQGVQYIKPDHYIYHPTKRDSWGMKIKMFRIFRLPFPDDVYQCVIPTSPYMRRILKTKTRFNSFCLEFIDGDLIWIDYRKFASLTSCFKN